MSGEWGPGGRVAAGALYSDITGTEINHRLEAVCWYDLLPQSCPDQTADRQPRQGDGLVQIMKHGSHKAYVQPDALLCPT